MHFWQVFVLEPRTEPRGHCIVDWEQAKAKTEKRAEGTGEECVFAEDMTAVVLYVWYVTSTHLCKNIFFITYYSPPEIPIHITHNVLH